MVALPPSLLHLLLMNCPQIEGFFHKKLDIQHLGGQACDPGDLGLESGVPEDSERKDRRLRSRESQTLKREKCSEMINQNEFRYFECFVKI